MPTRKTKPVYLFTTPTGKIVYESKLDMEADIDTCADILGTRPEVEIMELPMVVASTCEFPPKPKRAKVTYDTAFEEYWATVAEKKDKQKAYAEWKKLKA